MNLTNDQLNSRRQEYLDSLPEDRRAQCEKYMRHSVSSYAPCDGARIPSLLDTENLLEVLAVRNSYIVDNNFPSWKTEARRVENKDKAFIIGHSLMEEQDNLKGLLFSNIDVTRGNMFVFGLQTFDQVPRVVIERIDAEFISTFSEEALKRESRPKKKRKDHEFTERQHQHKAQVDEVKERILTILARDNLTTHVNDAARDRQRRKIIEFIRQGRTSAFRNWGVSSYIAEHCYAALLLETGDIQGKTRREFLDQANPNVFNDCRILQNALWLGVNILSRDRALERMVEYVGCHRTRVIAKL